MMQYLMVAFLLVAVELKVANNSGDIKTFCVKIVCKWKKLGHKKRASIS
jgi:hypothetical protein